MLKRKPPYKLYSNIAIGLVTYIPIILILIIGIFLGAKLINLFPFLILIIWALSPILGWFFEIPAILLAIYCYKKQPKYKIRNIATITISGLLMLLQIIILLFLKYPGMG